MRCNLAVTALALSRNTVSALLANDVGPDKVVEAAMRMGRTVKVGKLPWLVMRLLAPFVPLFRELVEMRYLWTTPTHMSNDRIKAVLGAEPRTPLPVAVRETLIGMGSL